tara:strand:+ start:3829 stop:6480 length:2652 start_codon:yes stop_codon:yes gene_type:complete
MPIKTSYKFDVKDKFTPVGFGDDEVTHIASSWQVSDHQDFGILPFEEVINPDFKTKVDFFAEDYLQGFKDYWIRCKFHSSKAKEGEVPLYVTAKFVKGSTEVTLLGRQSEENRQILEVEDLEYSIKPGMRVDLVSTSSGRTGGIVVPEGTLIRSIDLSTKKFELTHPSLHSGVVNVNLTRCVESDWSVEWRFRSDRGSWATINIGTQPTSQTNTAGACVTFTAGNVTITDGTEMEYIWQEELPMVDGETFFDIQNGGTAPIITGADTNSLTICNLRYPEDNGRCFRLKVVAETAADVFSDTVCITVLPVNIIITSQPVDHTVVQEPVVTNETVPCIGVIDETSPSYSTYNSDWAAFRTAWPNRPFWLMSVARGGSWGYNKIPQNMSSYPNPLTEHRVPRWGGDWFTLANLSQYPQGSTVALFVDDSGSMTVSTVSQALTMFEQKCSAAGINIIRVYNPYERYVEPFITNLIGPGTITNSTLVTTGGEFSCTAETTDSSDMNFQWQLKQSGESTFYPVQGAFGILQSGGTTTYETPPAIYPTDNGDLYRCKLTAIGALDKYSNEAELLISNQTGYSTRFKYRLVENNQQQPSGCSFSWIEVDLSNGPLDLVNTGVYEMIPENGSTPINCQLWGAGGGCGGTFQGADGGYSTVELTLRNTVRYFFIVGKGGRGSTNQGTGDPQTGGAAGGTFGGAGGGLTGIFEEPETQTNQITEVLSSTALPMSITGGGGGASVRSLGGAGGGIRGNDGADSGLDGGGAEWAGIGIIGATPGFGGAEGDGAPGGLYAGGQGDAGAAGGGGGYRGGGGGGFVGVDASTGAGSGGGGCGYFNNSMISAASTGARDGTVSNFIATYGAGGAGSDQVGADQNGGPGRIRITSAGTSSP